MLKTTNRRETNRLRQLVADELTHQPTPAATTKSGPVIFRIAITTQVYENYGAHDWDGIGSCPQYWKAKGGNEYQRVIGTANEVINLGRAGIERIVAEVKSKVEKSDDSWDEYMIGWDLYPSDEETYEEKDLREMLEWGMISRESHDEYRRRLAV